MIRVINPVNVTLYGQTEDQETDLMSVFGWLVEDESHDHIVLAPEVLLIEQFKLRNSLGPLAMTEEEAMH